MDPLQNIIEKKKIKREYCISTFMDKSNKLRHIKSKHLGKKFTYHQCSKSYSTKLYLSRHLTVGIRSKFKLNLRDPSITPMIGNPQHEPCETSPHRLLNKNDMRESQRQAVRIPNQEITLLHVTVKTFGM